MTVVRTYIEDGFEVTEYDNGYIVRVPIQTNVPQENVITETLEQKVERLEKQRQADNLTQFDVLATIYEELLMKT